MTVVEDIHAFIAAAEIADVIVYEERARRISLPKDSELSEPRTSIGIRFRVNGQIFGYRFRVIYADNSAEYVADIEIVYELQLESPDVSDELVEEFAERVAFMAVYPYVRASIFASTGRLGTPAPVMGIVRQGEFSTGDVMTRSEVRDKFFDSQERPWRR